MSTALPVVVAITGASGAPYAVRLLEALAAGGRDVWLIVSAHGWRLLDTESGVGSLVALRDRVGAAAWDSHVTVFDDGDRGARPASGSARSRRSSTTSPSRRTGGRPSGGRTTRPARSTAPPPRW